MERFSWNTARTLVMGILNVTPDSFSDGGRYLDLPAAVAQARAMIAAGADIIDVGGESSRPGSLPVSESEELRRVVPVIEQLQGVLVSVDTTKAEVARQALAAGARIVNDISAGRMDSGMFTVVGAARAGMILMHMRGTPATMQHDPHYGDVVPEVKDFLATAMNAACSAGVEKSQIAVDPGIGFGKTAAHNHRLLAALPELVALGFPVVVGASRKSFLGGPVESRLPGSLAVAAWAVMNGARVVRVHDVAETVAVVRLVETWRNS